MDVVSLGFRTDLALLRLGGSEVVDKGDHLVVRSPHNPTFWWGNFLLLQRPPSSGTVDRWLAAFAEEFPGRQHLAFGVDGTDGSAADLAAFAERGLDVEADTVMTATSVHPPPRPDTTAVYRQLTSDEDWAQDVALRVACEQRSLEPAGYLDFVERRAQTNRALTTSGRAAWFGAFLDGRLVSQLGVVALATASSGTSRSRRTRTSAAGASPGRSCTRLAGTHSTSSVPACSSWWPTRRTAPSASTARWASPPARRSCRPNAPPPDRDLVSAINPGARRRLPGWMARPTGRNEAR